MNGMPAASHARPTAARMRIIPGSLVPDSAVKRTTASAPSRAASSTSAICTTSGSLRSGFEDADSRRASDVVGANAGAAIRIMPLDIMITLAPPATASAVRVLMSASGSRNCGEVMPWSRAQMMDTPAGSMTRFMRIALPTLLITTTSFLDRAAAR